MIRAALALLAAVPLVATAPTHWGAVVTDADRTRLSQWRDAMNEGLAKARAGGAGAALAKDAVLLDPDRALDDPMPPAGDYRCRVVKLGAKGELNLNYVAYPWFTCRVGDGDAPVSFAKIDGSQRQVGALYAAPGNRAIFLGTLALSDERSAITYGRDESRDVAGWVERIDEHRWRMVMPRPRFESIVDVMEIVPAG